MSVECSSGKTENGNNNWEFKREECIIRGVCVTDNREDLTNNKIAFALRKAQGVS